MTDLNKISDKHSFFALVLLWLAFTSAAPFTFIQIPYHPHKYLIAFILVVFLLALAIKRHFKIGDKSILTLLAIQAVYFLFAAIFHEDVAFVALFTQAIAISITYLFTVNFVKFDLLVKSIVFLTCCMAVLGFIGFFLGYFNVISPMVEYKNPDGRTLYNYVLTFSNLVMFLDGAQIIRVAGYFDEPGTFAFYLIHALILNKLYVDSKRAEMIIIVGGLVTLSMAFFVSIFLYMIFFYIRIKKVFPATLILLAVGSFAYVVLDHGPGGGALGKVYEMTFERFEQGDNEERFVSGDSRTEDIVIGIEMIKEKPFLGYGLTYIKEETSYGLHTIVGPAVTQGIIGMAILFLHVLNICRVTYFSSKISVVRIDQMLCVGILLLNYIQRPFIFNFFTYFILICIFLIVKNQPSRNWNRITSSGKGV